MSTISTALGAERRSRASAYKIKRGLPENVAPNLPQVVIVLGEANTANIASITYDKKEITSADEAGQYYGYGSPIHQMMRILRPASGDGVGGIPTIVIPQETAVGASATVIVWTITGNATKNADHAILLGGREVPFAVAIDDTPTLIAAKIRDAVNVNLSSPFIATVAAGVLTLTTKWKGATSAETNAVISNNSNSAGVTYTLTSTTAGAGAVDLTDALALFGDNWYTTVINPYGAAAFAALEAFNGVPDDEAPTGRYAGLVFKPFMAFFGSTLDDKDDLATITDDASRVNQVTNVLCPAPRSAGMPWEAAANVVTLFARIMQDTPHLDVAGKSYPDMPVPLNDKIGDMSDYNNRDFLVKKGCSTVILSKGAYVLQDLVTTYHPSDENPLLFSYCRDFIIDWNIKDGYSILENLFVKDHVIVRDSQVTSAAKVVRPKSWKGTLYNYFNTLAALALINDPDFSKNSLQVQVSTSNPNRFETFFRYRRTGLARTESTDVEVNF